MSHPSTVFQTRRARLLREYGQGPFAFASGLPRVRNFEANRYPFRSESHFLFLIGRSIEEALLYCDGERWSLFMPPPSAEASLWYGPSPSLDELAEELGLAVRPLDEFIPDAAVTTVGSDDCETALWLGELLDREIEPAGGRDAADTALAEAVIRVRLTHDPHSLAQTELAIAATVAAHDAGLAALVRARSEAEVRAAMEAQITARALVPAYQSIVTTRGNVLHCETSRGELRPGALLLADVGAESPEGWAADLTRTWPTSGRFSPLQRDLYQAVRTAQRVAIDTVRPGVRFREVHLRAAATLTAELVDIGLLRGEVEGLLEQGISAVFFPHGIGHLLGLDVHDMEDLGDLAGYGREGRRSDSEVLRFLRLDRPLEAGMIVTIEPGFYCIDDALQRLAGSSLAAAVDAARLEQVRAEVLGIRIEDDVLVEAGGARVLSSQLIASPDDIEAAFDAARA